jgi:hypothetical protein
MMARPGGARGATLAREALEALHRRCDAAVAAHRAGEAARRDRLVEVAQEYAAGMARHLQPAATAKLHSLAAAIAPPAPPARPGLPATVGALRAMLASIPDATPITALPGADPEWLAAVARVLALAPPVRRVPEGTRATGAGRDAARSAQFQALNSPEALGL